MKGPVFLILISIILLSTVNCARVGNPAGGEKDIIPPEIVESTPNNYSKNFRSDRMEIEFNEYVRFDKLKQKLVISPPLDETPGIFIRGKKIIIDLGKQKLKENTTYTFSFYDAIVDNNEGNPIEDYEFVFSTGTLIDSLSINGIVLRAFDLEPEEEGVEVLLYDLLDDTIPQTTPPLYMGKADKKGKFRISNIKADTFRIFALKDANRNHYFDQAGEKFAFLDSTILVNASPEFLKDTLLTDTLITDTLITDTLITDTLITDTTEFAKKEEKLNARLFLFEEDHSIQYLKNSLRESREHIQFIFNKPLKNRELIIEALDIDAGDQWFIKEDFVMGDTVNIWITDTTVSNLDLLTLKLEYLKEDSTGNYISFSDTSLLRYIPPSGKGNRVENLDESEKPQKTLVLTPSIRDNSLVELNQKVSVTSKTPVKVVDTTKIKMYVYEDTIKKVTEYNYEKDTLQIRKYSFSVDWKGNTQYELFIEPDAFTSIYDCYNDTLLLNFKTRGTNYYGKIILNLKTVPENMIIQLLESKGKVIKEKTDSLNKTIEFSYLKAGEYRLKAIYDRNKNGKWDTGNYKEKIQPEKVIFYDEILKVRSNWDLEIEWDLSAN